MKKALLLFASTMLFAANTYAAGLNASGNPIVDTTVSSHDIGLDGNKDVSDDEVNAILAAHPDIARDVMFLQTITRIVTTDADTLDIYVGTEIATILEMRDGLLFVRETAVPFQPMTITPVMSGQAQSAWISQLVFGYQACVNERPQPASCTSVDFDLNLTKAEQPL